MGRNGKPVPRRGRGRGSLEAETDRPGQAFYRSAPDRPFFFYLSWVLIIPFGKAPDEPLRFDIVKFIAQYHRLPVAGDHG